MLGVVIVGGKTSHLFVGGEDVGGTSSLVPGVPHSRYFFCFFSVDNLYLFTFVPGTTYQ